MDAYIWINSDFDACITRRDGTVEVIDLPDEMYEDLIHAKVRRVTEQQREALLKKALPRLPDIDLDELTAAFDQHVAGWILPVPQGAQPIDPDDEDELSELEWDDDEVTQPMGATFEQMQEWKDKGLCPKCGDITRESAVGICRDHGKFMG